MALPALAVMAAQAYMKSKGAEFVGGISRKVIDAGSSAADSFQDFISSMSMGSEGQGKDHLFGNTLEKANKINDLRGTPGIIDEAVKARGIDGPLAVLSNIIGHSPSMEDRSNNGPSH